MSTAEGSRGSLYGVEEKGGVLKYGLKSSAQGVCDTASATSNVDASTTATTTVVACGTGSIRNRSKRVDGLAGFKEG